MASNMTASASGSASGSAPAAAAASGGAGAKAAPAPTPDSLMIVYHIDIILLALIALLVVMRFPRFLARLWHTSEWTNGFVLRQKPFYRRAERRVQFSMAGNPSTGDLSTYESHTVTFEKGNAQRVGVDGRSIAPSYPPHVSSCVSLFRPLLVLMHKRIVPGVSFSHLVVMAVWLGVLIYPTFYRTNAFTDPVRFGFITVSQMPFVFAFATKNNVLGAFLGVGYEKLNFLHRFVGRLTVLAVNVHGLGYIYKWLIAKTFREDIAEPKFYWGLIGLIAFDMLFFFSTEFWRKKAYNIFLCTHIIGFSLLLPVCLLHFPVCRPWAYAAFATYGFDLFLRTIKTRFATAIVRPIPELGLTRVEIPNINSGWRAGQHVRVRVLSAGMGLIGWTEIHPFTIASIADGPEGLVLMCKKAGSWTNNLYEIAKTGGYDDEIGKKVTMVVEGPYGGPGHRIFSSFSAAVFVVGGSGITFATSAIQELIQQDLEGHSRVKLIHLIWTVQDASALTPMLPLFNSMIQQSVFTPLRISVFYTRAPIGKFPFAEDFFRSTSLTLSPGRPKLHKHFEETINKVVAPNGMRSSEDRSGLLIGVCGPVSLADSVFGEVNKIDSYRRDQVGGVEVHEETFGW